MLDVEALSEMMAGIISEEVEKAVAPLNARIAELETRPHGPQMDDVKGVVEIMISDALVVKAAREIEIPELPDFGPMIEGAVGKAIAALPAPKDGKDAAGIVEALKDSGELVLTLQDGRLIRTGIRDGEKAKDGRDGFELSDYDEWFEDDGRTLVRRFVVGEDFKEFRHQTALPIYRNVFKEGQTYQRGDVVTFGSSAWHCEKETADKPGLSDSWVLMVKKGRDGKDAK